MNENRRLRGRRRSGVKKRSKKGKERSNMKKNHRTRKINGSSGAEKGEKRKS